MNELLELVRECHTLVHAFFEHWLGCNRCTPMDRLQTLLADLWLLMVHLRSGSSTLTLQRCFESIDQRRISAACRPRPRTDIATRIRLTAARSTAERTWARAEATFTRVCV